VIVLPTENSPETNIRERWAAKTLSLASYRFYRDGETFGRIYTDREKAAGFAVRQKKSPVVKMARITQLS
jgi:hypothetical protein